MRKWWADVMDDMTLADTELQGYDTGRLVSLLYVNNGEILSKDNEWLKNAIQYLCNLFRDCTDLKPNTEKTETMICHPGAIRSRCLIEGNTRWHEGTGETYTMRKGKRTVCPFTSSGKDLALGSLQSHYCK